MNEERVWNILGDCIDVNNNSLHSLGWYVSWTPGRDQATLDGEFTADDLEAIAWWMRNKK